mgnify:CR=1 FL=1
MENRLSEKATLIFRDLEEEIMEIIIKRLKKGTNNKKDITQWQFEKLQDLGLINLQTVQKVTEATQLLEEEVEDAFRIGPDTVIRQVDKASLQKIKEPSTNIEQIVKGYLSRAKNELNLTDEGLALWTYGSFDTIQKYRGIIERSAAFVNTGIHTLEQAVERASHEILTEGLKTTMTSKSGRRIPVDSYVRGVLKTNLGRTMDEVRKEHMEEYGMHHVVVGSSVGAREACSKIQGQVVDLRPMDEIPEGSEYRSIYDPYWEAHYKEASGHHGINCRHPHFPFIPGVNTNNQPQYDDELNEQVAKDQQKQRSLERQIRNYKKHLKIAQEFGNQEDIDRYTKLISGRQKALREHLDGHKYLSRDYNRERAFDFSTSPPKDIVKPEVPKSKPEPEPRPTIELVEVSDDVVEYFDSKDSDESLEFFQKQFEYTQWKSQLEPLELDSIQEYSEEVYEHTNAYLRTGKGYLDMMTDELGDGGFYAEEVRLTTELIDSGISSYTTQENMKVYRSLQESTVPQEVKDLITNAQPGDRIVPDKSFQSTAVSKKEAIEFGGNILYDIEIPKGLNVGAYIREYSAFSFEDEFLLRPNLEFEVLENNIENGKVIKLRVLGIKE